MLPETSLKNVQNDPISTKNHLEGGDTSVLQCFDTVGWAAGRASGL